jgi:Mycotoxin biosynthesis protein UstYa
MTKRPAPVQDALEYELKTFPRAGQTSPYHGPPSDAVDNAWEDLYSCKSFRTV